MSKRPRFSLLKLGSERPTQETATVNVTAGPCGGCPIPSWPAAIATAGDRRGIPAHERRIALGRYGLDCLRRLAFHLRRHKLLPLHLDLAPVKAGLGTRRLCGAAFGGYRLGALARLLCATPVRLLRGSFRLSSCGTKDPVPERSFLAQIVI